MWARTNYNDNLIIRVWKACNFRCNFCNISYNERNVQLKESLKNIVAQFHYKFKYSNLESKYLTITISWWEPSIFQKETIFILKYIKKFLDNKNIESNFEIQTNASNIDNNFANKLSLCWVKMALVSFHTIEKNIYEKVLWVKYENFYKVLEWIKNLQNNNIEVITNSILSNENKNNFFETIKFLKLNFPLINFFNIWTIQPNGDALININIVAPKYEEIEKEYNKVFFYLKKSKKEYFSHYVWPPACYIYSKHDSLEIVRNSDFRKNFNFSEKYYINKINDKNKIQIKDCEKCLYNNICSGIWKEYVWLQKLKPVNYIIDKNNNFEKNNFAYKLKNKDKNLKKIYDWNFRQIIIKTSLWNEVEIYELLKNATKIWFYKVTLLVDSDFEIKKDIVYTGVSNIQCKKEQISNEVLYFIKNFSEKYSPQFRIDIDFI